jgi:hypothetical protein
MTRQTPGSRRFASALIAVGLASISIIALAAQAPSKDAAGPQQTVPTVAVSALVPLLPPLEGWTKGRAASDRIVVSDSCSYSFADAIYKKGEATVRVSVADTGFGADSLVSLATMVMTLPETYNEEIPPATRVARITFKESPAATLWDPVKSEGEFVVVVGGRFVAKAEGSHLENLDVLRAIVDQIDLKKLSELR